MTRLDWIIGSFFGIAGACTILLALQLGRKIHNMNVFPKVWESGKLWMENSWMASLPATNFKTVTTTGLYYLTFAAWAAALLLEKTIDEWTLGLWLAFLAGLGGFTFAQFRTQRNTDYGALDRQAEIERAKHSGAPTTVNADRATVTGSPVSVDQPSGGQAG